MHLSCIKNSVNLLKKIARSDVFVYLCNIISLKI
jgi:hypothetical protein